MRLTGCLRTVLALASIVLPLWSSLSMMMIELSLYLCLALHANVAYCKRR